MNNKKRTIMRIIIILITVFVGYQTATTAQQNPIEEILHNGSALVKQVIEKKEKYRLGIRYTMIDRTKNGKISLKEFSFGIDDAKYFYPASTVKFPVAVIAAEKANKFQIPLSTPMFIDSCYPGQSTVNRDNSSSDGYASIAHYIRKIFLVSDNDAYNRLYEFIGRAELNEALFAKRYNGTNLITRLSVPLTTEQNKHTNPIRFGITKSSLVQFPGRYDPELRINTNDELLQGVGYYSGDSLINAPFSFLKKNRFTLQDMHTMLKTLIFPNSFPSYQRFNLKNEDRNFILKAMAELPRESDFPKYGPYSRYYDGYVKYFLFGDSKDSISSHIRIFNKVGQAYGYLIDNAYIIDKSAGVEFFLSAVIYVNEDGIFNDDKYEYETIGYPVLAEVGRLFYQFERLRMKSVRPDLTPLFQLFQTSEKK